MSVIEIHTLWGQRKVSYPGEIGPELMVAWDEFCVEANGDGFQEACDMEIKSWGDDLVEHRVIILKVTAEAIAAAFTTPTIRAMVDPS